jgi:hypothetical protein
MIGLKLNLSNQATTHKKIKRLNPYALLKRALLTALTRQRNPTDV